MAELERLRQGGIGFVINTRPEGAKIHRVNCKTVEGMYTGKYAKLFCQKADDAIRWVITGGAWENCGLCGGVGTTQK